MAQTVITEGYRVNASKTSYPIDDNSAIKKALLKGWRIQHTSSVAMPEMSMIFVTYTLDYVEAEPAKEYKGLL